MPALDASLTQKIDLLTQKHLRRDLVTTRRGADAAAKRDEKSLISFSCNDYLGLSQHPDLIAAAHKAIDIYGVGAGASRLVSGNHPLYDALEESLADYKYTQRALAFGSGYLACLGSIPALVGSGDLIIADKLIHACMLDAARLSGATIMRFAHNNTSHANMLLEANRHEHHNCLLLTETVFSMDGDCAPLDELRTLCDRFDAWLMTDDAHGLGVLPRARSVADIQMGTLSKAAGSYGGYVAGSGALIDHLINSARSLIFSTALPPATVAASHAAITYMTNNPDKVAKPLEKAQYFTKIMGMPNATSAIVPLILEENEKALRAAQELKDAGFLVAAIRPPTVPHNKARLRFAFSAMHSNEQIEALVSCLKNKGITCALPL